MSTLRKLFDLQLGSWFRYQGQSLPRTYVLLNRHDCGLIADAPDAAASRQFQGLYSAAETHEEFIDLIVEVVPVVPVTDATVAVVTHSTGSKS